MNGLEMKRKLFNLLFAGAATIVISIVAWLIYGKFNEWMMKRNDGLAQQRAPELFRAIESYLVKRHGEFPKRREDLAALMDLKGDVPFCGEKKDGYVYDCAFGLQEYGLHVYPIKNGRTGRYVFNKSKSSVIYVDQLPASQNRKLIKQTSKGYLEETQDDFKKTLLPEKSGN